jgi:dCMP deaminase
VASLLDFVTKSWRSRWVITSIPSEAVLDALSRRPFFILISVDAPLLVRWKRYQARSSSSSASASAANATTTALISLEDFVAQSDAELFAAPPGGGVLAVASRAALRLLNASADLAHLYATLGKLELTDATRLRPSWDAYFMSLASLAAQRSNCMKRAVGCVLVGPERRVISTGYNGTPRGVRNCGDGGCPRCNAGEGSGVALATCLCLHAEENALLESGRERIREGSVLYCNTCPCLTCSIKIVQVGISEVVYSQGYSMDGNTAEVFRSAGVKLRQFSPVSLFSITLHILIVLFIGANSIITTASKRVDTLGQDGAVLMPCLVMGEQARVSALVVPLTRDQLSGNPAVPRLKKKNRGDKTLGVPYT